MALAYRDDGIELIEEVLDSERSSSNDNQSHEERLTETVSIQKKEIQEIDLKSIEKVILMHEDVSAALASLPDFGFMTKKNLADIHEAQNMVNDLRIMLGNYLYTENKYKETLVALLKLLEKSGVGECVEDLMTVRKNSRSN
jgi:hypothetical protein